MLNNLRTTVATPSKCPGLAFPHKQSTKLYGGHTNVSSVFDSFVFSNFYVDTVPCIHALERLRKAVRKHYYYTLLVQFISAIKRGRRHEVSYYGLQTILDDERRYRGETEEFKAIEKTIERHYYWDTIESIEDGECQTYDFTVPESHSFWSNGFISHNTPKGFNELYKLYKLGQNKVRQMRKQWHSWQVPQCYLLHPRPKPVS